jgi:hypothetical protein
MFAISKSRANQLLRRFAIYVKLAVLTILVFCVCQSAPAQTNQTFGKKTLVQYATSVYETSRDAYRRDSTNLDIAIRFGAACFEYAEFSTNDTQRASLADEGINAMRTLLTTHTNSAHGHYYLAMNLGQLARTKSLGALRIVREMEDEFKLASELDDRLDYAGPDRNLGELYYQAPGWPASIGSNSKARKRLERSVEIAPDYPENRLNLLEAYLDWRDKKGIDREWKALKKLMPAARTNFTGIQWAARWNSWDAQWDSLDRHAALALSR